MKLRFSVSLLVFGFLFSFTLSAQQRCYTYQHMLEQIRTDPVFAKKMLESEKSFDNYVSKRNHPDLNFRNGPLKIPVIVHVVYRTNSEKISKSQVESQIEVLSEDFDATNSDYNGYDAGYGSVKGDANIDFCLVQVRWVKTKKRSFNTNDDVKRSSKGGSDPVDPSKYLNIWVCNIGQGILGYAQFPGGAAATDGVVVNYLAFGRGAGYNLYDDYDLGRTATHEVGHWLGLRHIWGDQNCGNDFCDDTPVHNTYNFGCPDEGHLSTCSGTPPEMWMNYMDYTDDRCMYFFSDDQVTRMDMFLETDSRLISISTLSDCSVMADVEIDNSGGSGGGPGGGGGPPGNPGGGNPHNKLAAGDIQVYPTISHGLVTLRIHAIKNGTGMVRVYNQTGLMVYQLQLGVAEGENFRTINVGKLPAGFYILRYSQGDIQRTEKIVLQN